MGAGLLKSLLTACAVSAAHARACMQLWHASIMPAEQKLLHTMMIGELKKEKREGGGRSFLALAKLSCNAGSIDDDGGGSCSLSLCFRSGVVLISE